MSIPTLITFIAYFIVLLGNRNGGSCIVEAGRPKQHNV